jgi:hypothetical protein
MRGEMKEKDLTAYCGLYCGDCVRYQSRSSDLAKQLLNELGGQKFSEYAKLKSTHKKELENYDVMVSELKVISEFKCELLCQLGGDGCEGPCEIIKCVKDKDFDGCWQCDSFEKCEKIDFLKPFHENAPVNNLRKIKELGIDYWSKHREKCYPWL